MFTDYYDELLIQVKSHDFSNLPPSELRGALEKSQVPYNKSKLWEKSFSSGEDFSARYSYFIKHKHDNKKHIFILLDHIPVWLGPVTLLMKMMIWQIFLGG